jgi:hypothetical protein
MLIRPVVAGPDGSMYQGCYYNQCSINNYDTSTASDNNNSSRFQQQGRIDWDDADSVSNIIDDLHLRLEMALRTSYESHNNDNNTATSNNGDVTATSTKESTKNVPLFIRRITVVTGKGFYTYCAGLPAPFLRVEYYDPSMRWRVKMILERGVDLDMVYHPDPCQYDYDDTHHDTTGNLVGSECTTTALLKFRCYEAHIPYTMQVFKDYNLSGMNYCKIADAKFRSMPTTLRQRFFSRKGNDNDCVVKSIDERCFFLQHTTSEELLWPRFGGEVTTMSQDGKNISIDQYWLRKETSCDLEFDTTVYKIMNVLDVMKELPSSLEERQKIHWRAVPSLREIWEQERKRMAILLPPENDFLSCNGVTDSTDVAACDESFDEEVDGTFEAEEAPPPFTLNVKKHASLPGTRHAVKGMQQLFRPSLGLEDELRRAMKDIISHHEGFLEGLDERLEHANGKKKIHGISHSFFLSQQQTSPYKGDFHTPSLDDGIEALAVLGEQFSQTSDVEEGDFKMLSQSTPIARNIQSLENANFETTSLSQEEVADETEALAFGRAVDEDEIVDAEDTRNNATNIDPFTLEVIDHDDSCEFLDDEERMGERKLDDLFTQLETQSEESHCFNNSCNDAFKPREMGNFRVFDEGYSLAGHSEDIHNDIVVLGKSLRENEEGNGAIFYSSSQSTFGSSKNSLKIGRNISMGQQSQVSIHTSQSSEQEFRFNLLGSTFEPVRHVSLRCADVKSLSWYETPDKNATEFPPHWFYFRWKKPAAPPSLQRAAFFEPVSRPPSFSHVSSWVKENRKRSTPIDTKHVSIKQKKIYSHSSKQIQSSRERQQKLTYTQRSQIDPTQENGSPDPLDGLGNQGGKLHVSSGGLKTSTISSNSFTPLTIMSIEVHVQCRIKTGMKDHRDIAMVPDPNRDAVFAVVYVYGRDPGKCCGLISCRCHSISRHSADNLCLIYRRRRKFGNFRNGSYSRDGATR